MLKMRETIPGYGGGRPLAYGFQKGGTVRRMPEKAVEREMGEMEG